MSSGDDTLDEVDRIVHAWHQVRPDLNLLPLHVLSRVGRLAHQLDRARAAVFHAHGVELWEFDVLAALRRAGDPFQLSPGQLVAQTLVTSGTMTNRIDRLSARELVRRGPHPRDGRGVIVQLLPPGQELVDAALADLLQVEEQTLQVLSGDEQQQVAGQLRRLLVALEQAALRP